MCALEKIVVKIGDDIETDKNQLALKQKDLEKL